MSVRIKFWAINWQLSGVSRVKFQKLPFEKNRPLANDSAGLKFSQMEDRGEELGLQEGEEQYLGNIANPCPKTNQIETQRREEKYLP